MPVSHPTAFLGVLLRRVFHGTLFRTIFCKPVLHELNVVRIGLTVRILRPRRDKHVARAVFLLVSVVSLA